MVAVGEFDEPRVVLVPAKGLVECSSHRIVSLIVVAVSVAASRAPPGGGVAAFAAKR